MRRFTVISMIVLGSALLFLTGESSQTFAQRKRAGAAAEQAHRSRWNRPSMKCLQDCRACRRTRVSC